MTQDHKDLTRKCKKIFSLAVWSQEPGHFGPQQLDEGAREHLFGLCTCVLKVILGVGEYVKQGFY